MPEKPLSSWKEIASYLGRSVRTVQRWERELALPIRRPSSKESSTVLAFPEQIDQWLKSIGARSGKEVRALPDSISDMSKPQLSALLRNLLFEENRAFAQFEEKRAVARKLVAQLCDLCQNNEQ